MTSIAIKRIYEEPSDDDGYRILVDRLWPRGLSREKARIDLWIKDIAPSDTLRKWFSHDPGKWTEFKKRYFAELDGKPKMIEEINQARNDKITLLYGAKDEHHNNAVALKQYITEKGIV
ncbi:MAG: DUF488 domain-containing protein [Syntrophorhabdus sp.]